MEQSRSFCNQFYFLICTYIRNVSVSKYACFKFFLYFFFSFITINCYAQKLPNTQTISLWIPETVKIDGKLTEWGGKLQAYNRNNKVEYIIANNNKDVYLAFKATDKVTIGKILASGISILINPSGTKKLEGASITYPLKNLEFKSNTYAYFDSTKIQHIILTAKEIKLVPADHREEQKISIYNDLGVKVNISYDKGILIYELLMPLKLMNLTADNKKISYNIKFNGLDNDPQAIPMNAVNGPVPPPPPMGLPANRSPNSLAGMVSEIRPTTDFWSTYILLGKINP